MTKAEIDHLMSIEASLSFAETSADLAEIRREMHEAGFTKKSGNPGKKKPEKAAPLHFITEDGFHVYVGKNNYQNEEVTFKIGSGKDMWFHVKTLHGSHVIIKTEGKELPIRTISSGPRWRLTTPKAVMPTRSRSTTYSGRK